MAGISQASHVGAKGGVVVEGVDAVVREFRFHADEARPKAAVLVVAHAAHAAQKMRDHVPVGATQRTLDSITADTRPTIDEDGVSADAGPEWFVGRLLENGTVNMSPRPFVGPAADEEFPLFQAAMAKLAGW